MRLSDFWLLKAKEKLRLFNFSFQSRKKTKKGESKQSIDGESSSENSHRSEECADRGEVDLTSSTSRARPSSQQSEGKVER